MLVNIQLTFSRNISSPRGKNFKSEQNLDKKDGRTFPDNAEMCENSQTFHSPKCIEPHRVTPCSTRMTPLSSNLSELFISKVHTPRYGILVS